MNLFTSLRSFFNGSNSKQDIDDELRSHIEHRADDLMRSGLARDEAWRRARIEFGGYVRFKEESHAAAGGQFLETLTQDLRFATRVLRKSPGFAVTAVLTLALAIGANAVVFSVMNAFVLRPLNVPGAQSLYALFHEGNAGMSYLNYLDMRDRNHSFESLAAFEVAEAGLSAGADPSRAWVYEVTGNYFETLGQQPYLGRLFSAVDERGPDSAPYIVLNYAYWKAHFESDRGVVGRVVLVNKHPFTIVGVSQPEFHGTLLFFSPDFYVPLVDDALVQGLDVLNARNKAGVFMMIGHLKSSVTRAQAIGDLNSVGSYLEKTYPKDNGKLVFTLNRPNLYGDHIGGPVRAFMTALMLLAGLILLAACANLGSLFAARAADRSREVALRLALGSSRRRILRGLFTEAALISLAGGAIGFAGGMALLRGLSAWEPFPRWPIHLEVTPDASVYAVALLLTIVSGFLFGAVPVRQILRTNPYEVVKGGMSGVMSRKGRRVTARDVLLVIQIAICSVLVTSSMVAVRGLARSLHDDFGFEVNDRLLLDTDLNMADYKGDQVPRMQKRLVDALETIPGVESVGLADSVPLVAGTASSNVFADSTGDLRPSNSMANPDVFKVSWEYFHAAGTSLLAGRAFTPHNDKSSPRVAVVNGEFAREVFKSAERPVGRYFKMPDGARVEVVGLVEDGKYDSLTEAPQAAMFLPILQAPSSQTYLIVHSIGATANRDPEELVASIRSKLREVDVSLPVQIQTRYNGLDAMLFGPRMATISLGVLGVMGGMLSITGIFGMAAYSVSKRLRELGFG